MGGCGGGREKEGGENEVFQMDSIVETSGLDDC